MGGRAVTGLIAIVAALLAWPAAAAAITSVKVGDFEEPVNLTAPPGDPHRLFVVEIGGRIQLIHGAKRRTFLDLGGKVDRHLGEQGLYSLAFPADYATSGRFYVYYTAPLAGDPEGDLLTVAEYRRSAKDPDRADPASERIVLTIRHPFFGNHNGGHIAFGPDGLLYLATGDGGGQNDPGNHAQDPASLLGKMLRIDPSKPGARPQIYARGLRNPWRFSFDRATGDLTIGDVGQDEREEVDLSPAGTPPGRNYGWDCREGFAAGPGTCAPGPLTAPVFDYPHTSPGDCTGAVTGGYVVRNHDLDSLYGRYVYTDFCGTGDVRSLVLRSPKATGDSSTGLVDRYIPSFGEDSCGHLYIVSIAGEVDLLTDGAVTPCPEPKPPKDVTPPRLTVARKFRQHLSPHRSLYVDVRCDERCAVTAGARIDVPGRDDPFRAAQAIPSLAGGKRANLRLMLTPKAGRAARRALRKGKQVVARLRIVARDAAGNQTTKSRRVLVLP